MTEYDKMLLALNPYSGLKPHALALTARAVECAADVPGAIVECGVASGGSAMWLWHALGRNRHLWLFDSWQGLPRPDGDKDGGRACAKWDYKIATSGYMCRGRIEDVIRAARVVDIPLDLLHFVPGWFSDTVPKAHDEIGAIAALHLDGDWYESIMTPLTHFWPHISPGGVVVFDDYNAWPGAKRAADEFAADNGLEVETDIKPRIVKHGD